MAKKAKNLLDLEALEIEAAASILIYNSEELKIFMDIYNGTVSDNELGISGPFAKFLNISFV